VSLCPYPAAVVAVVVVGHLTGQLPVSLADLLRHAKRFLYAVAGVTVTDLLHLTRVLLPLVAELSP
jgi:hypothetical protein